MRMHACDAPRSIARSPRRGVFAAAGTSAAGYRQLLTQKRADSTVYCSGTRTVFHQRQTDQ
ncbi:hypothetical protein KWO_001695 [Xanthomonas vasicola pv. musacearum NCPPB 4379]|nr:hypothetical protein KWO_001695 [Xanthomonas vasicola pv. musacearum NCPPB 4379]